MAPYVRSAKPGKRWVLADLSKYNISLNEVDPLSFFGLQELPEPSVHPELLNTSDPRSIREGPRRQLLNMLDIVHSQCRMCLRGFRIEHDTLDMANQFTVALFQELGYTDNGRVPECTRRKIPFVICRRRSCAWTSVLLAELGKGDIIELVAQVQDREERNPTRGSARLVASAVAAFHENNEIRNAQGLFPLADKVMPGIVMTGSSPTFYKIPITGTLVSHIRDGTWPPEETVVTFCRPPVPRPDDMVKEGMVPFDSRRVIFSCFEAFKATMGYLA